MNLCIIILAFIPLVFADEISDCTCLEGYRPQLDEDGKAMCYGIHVKAFAPCNMIKKPTCQCGPEVTGILNDASGVWCVTYNRGRRVKKWRCENREEWETFLHHQHPNVQHVSGQH